MRYVTITFFACAFAMTALGEPAESKDQLVFVGDSKDQVYEMLGDPNIEFPKDGMLMCWYAGYEVSFRNNIAVNVKIKPVMTEEEKLEKQRRAELADQRLRDAYKASEQKEQMSYNAWLERERKRRADERLEKMLVEAEKNRKSAEKKAAIRSTRPSHDVYIHDGY